MEDLWKHHSRPQQSFGGAQVNAANAAGTVSQLNHPPHHHHHPFVAQEVCVTIRQETLGANHLINFGGLEGGLKQQQSIRSSDQGSNQLLALVQQQQQQHQQHSLHHSAGGIVTSHHPHLQHHLVSSTASANAAVPWSGVQELHPATTNRALLTDVATTASLDRDLGLLKNRSRTKKSDVDFFKDSSLSRSTYDAQTSCSTDFRNQQQLHGQALLPPQRKSINSANSTSHAFPAGLRVYTPGAQGLIANGELLLTDRGRLEVVCLCHGCAMTVAKFVQHAGSHSVNPGNAVYLETGETLVQWRRKVFTRVGVPVPDDEAGWDSGDGSETSRNVHTPKLPETFTSCQPVQMANLPASLNYGNYQDAVFQGCNRSSKGAELLSPQFQRIVGAVKPMHFDFINGGRAYSSAEQQLGLRERILHSDQARKPWDENVRQDKDSFASSFELRLGQPSQQAQKAGASFGTAFRSQMQTTEMDQPTSLVYERAYQKIDASLHPGSVHGYGFQSQQDVQQFTQQQRLEKINVVNFGHYGPAALERTVLSERTKFWTEPPNQNGNRVSSEHGDSFYQLKPHVPENSLELLSQSQMKQRMVSHRLLNDVVGFTQMDSQQYVSQECSQVGWSNNGTRYLQSKEKEVVHCFGGDGTRAAPAPQETLACRMSSSSCIQQQGMEHKATGSVLDGQEALHIGEQFRSKARLCDNGRAETEPANPSIATPGKSALDHKAIVEHPYIVDEANRNSTALLVQGERNSHAASSQNLTRDSLLEGKPGQHHEDTSSIIPANSGLLVSVGENELPTGTVHSEKNVPLENGSFGWNAPAKPCDGLEVPGETTGEGILAGKTTSLEDEDETSEVSTKSSENVASFSDAHDDVNDEASTLESESREHDLIDEGSGIGKSSSEKFEAGDTRELSLSPSDRSSSEANESVMIEGLQEVQHEDKVERRGRKKVASLNDTIMARNSKGNDSGVSELPASNRRQQRDDEEQNTALCKLTPKQKRSRTTVRKTRSASLLLKDSHGDIARGKQKNTLLKIKVKSRDPPAGTDEQDSDSSDQRKHNRTGNGGNGKMMSMKSIMKHATERRISLEGFPRFSKNAEGQGCKEDGGALRKEIRKRKLSELNSSMPDPSANVTCRPFRVGQSIIPRGERSPRGATRKTKSLATDDDSQRQTSSVAKKKLESGQTGKSSLAETEVVKRRRTTNHQQTTSTFSGIREPGTTQTVKLKCVEDELELKKHCKKAQPVKENACSVCGSSKSESHNQLIYCSACPVKVHQACYGVPKVPKSSWTCRPCKSEVENIVCVLCGYRGGAMTRAQNAQTVVKGLLKAWKAGSGERPKPGLKQVRRSERNSAREIEEVSNTITASVSDPSVAQWVHMVCALWMPGTRCLNLGTMGMFDVSGVSVSRRRLTCTICKREGGSCIQCHEAKCAVPFHAWCAHSKGLLQIETVNDTDGHVRFHGKCIDHAEASVLESRRNSKCARAEEYNGKPSFDDLRKPTRKDSQKT
ncbi:uncharacterized protein LOC9649438 [Selaginella moellendorffii]|uniref:uncharacterized protein LOC9649438 n=1 Tax=Selaginella moellendorffii TaxID=88036 RepID=UPI000D1C491F|nr:uncharacterized protein LOC9649438 [Selaginella moellendorffii]|eukprot:XP_024514948.1 uncharacterized protein LOC9649438 [Selaginella moellendorffii]